MLVIEGHRLHRSVDGPVASLDEIAAVISFLISDKASFVHGGPLVV